MPKCWRYIYVLLYLILNYKVYEANNDKASFRNYNTFPRQCGSLALASILDGDSGPAPALSAPEEQESYTDCITKANVKCVASREWFEASELYLRRSWEPGFRARVFKVSTWVKKLKRKKNPTQLFKHQSAKPQLKWTIQGIWYVSCQEGLCSAGADLVSVSRGRATPAAKWTPGNLAALALLPPRPGILDKQMMVDL